MPTQRKLQDAALNFTKYLPAAAANNQTSTLDLGATVGGEPKLLEIEVVVPALPNHTDNTKTILFTLQDSADDVTYTSVAPLQEGQLVGVASTGSVETTYRFALPSTIRRYVQFKQTVPSGAGDNTAALVTYSPCF